MKRKLTPEGHGGRCHSPMIPLASSAKACDNIVTTAPVASSIGDIDHASQQQLLYFIIHKPREVLSDRIDSQVSTIPLNTCSAGLTRTSFVKNLLLKDHFEGY